MFLKLEKYKRKKYFTWNSNNKWKRTREQINFTKIRLSLKKIIKFQSEA